MHKSWRPGAALLVCALLCACPSPEAVDPPPPEPELDGKSDGGDDAGNADGGVVQEGGAVDGGSDAGAAPKVIARMPAPNATAVELDAGVSAVFDLAVDPSSVSVATFVLASDAGLLSGTVSYDETSRTALFEPAGLLPEATRVTATVTAGVRSASGVPMTTAETWTFTTQTLAPPDTTAPTVTATSPDGGAGDVPVTAVLTAEFSEDVQPASVTTASFALARTSSSGNTAVPGSVSYDAQNRRATFTPGAALVGSSTYAATLGAGIKDAAGNSLLPFSFSFSTEADATAPTVVSTVPADGAAVPALTHAVSIQVSEPLDPTTVTAANVSFSSTLVDGGSSSLDGVVTWDEATRTIGFVPTSAFVKGAAVTGTLSTGVMDLAGNAMAAPHAFTFMVESDGEAPTVAFAIPPSGARLVPRSATIKVTFNEDVDATTVNAANLSVGGQPAVVTYDAASRTATLRPNVFLPPASSVAVTVKDVKDASGTSMASPVSWSFRTLGDAVKLSADTLPDVRNLVAATSAAGTMAVWLAFPGLGGRLQWALRSGTSWTGGALLGAATTTDVPTLIAMGSRFGARIPGGVSPQFSVFESGTWTPTSGYVDGVVGAVGAMAVNVAWNTGAVDAYTLAQGSTSWAGPTPLAASGAYAVVATSGNLLGVTYRVFATSSTCRLAFKRFDGSSWSQFEAAIATINGSCATAQPVRLVGNGTTFAAAFLDGINGARVAIYDVASDSWTATTLGAAQGPLELATNGAGGFAAFYRSSTHMMASTWSGSSWSAPIQVDTDPTVLDRVVGWSGGYVAFRNATGGTLVASVLANGAVTNTQLKLPGGGSGAKVLSAQARSNGVAITYGANGDTFLRVYENNAWSGERKLNVNGVSRAAVLTASRVLSSDLGVFTSRELQSGTTLGAAELIPPGAVRGTAGLAQPAIRADRTALFAWPQYEAGEAACFVRYFNGASWSAPSKLPIQLVGPPLPERCLAVTEGRVFVIAWVRSELPANDTSAVYAATWTPDSGLGAPVRVSASSLNASDLMGQSSGTTVALIWSSNSPGRGSGNVAASTSADGITWSSPTNVLSMTTTTVTYEPVSFAASPAGYIFSTYSFGSTITRAVAFGGVVGSQNTNAGNAQVAAGRTRVAVLDATSSSSALHLSSGAGFSSLTVASNGTQSAVAPFGPEFRLAVGGGTYLTSGTTIGAAGSVDNWTTGEVSMRCDTVGCGMFGRSSPNFTELRTHYTVGNRLVLLGNVLGNAQSPQLYFAAGRYGLEYLTHDANKQAAESWWIWD